MQSIKICLIVFMLHLLGCSSQPEYSLAKDAINDINKIDAPKELMVPDAAYDALVPEINMDKVAPIRFDVAAKNNSAKAFFMGLVDGMGINMIIDPAVNKRISLNLKNVTLKVFHVNYLNVSRRGTSGMSVASGHISNSDSGSSSSDGSDNSSSSGNAPSITTATKIETNANTDFWVNLQNTINIMIGSGAGRRVVVDAQAGLIVVQAYPDELAAVENFLQRAELSLQKQVIIEAKIIEVTLNDGFQSGIQWDTFGAGPGAAFAGSGREVAGQLTAETVRNSDGLAGVFSLNFDTSDFTGVIQLLQRQGEVQVLSSPRISTVNNQKAVIKVGTDEFFVTNVSSSTTTSTTSTNTTPEISLTPFFSGIALDVTPQIGSNDEVILHVHPSVTEVVERNKVIEVGSDTFDLPLAYSSIRETDSIIRAKSGQVVVIGGLLQNKKTSTNANVPWLSRIPILGYLFRQTERSSSKSELVILLQPKVIEPSGWNDEINNIKNTFPRWQQQGATGDGK